MAAWKLAENIFSAEGVELEPAPLAGEPVWLVVCKPDLGSSSGKGPVWAVQSVYWQLVASVVLQPWKSVQHSCLDPGPHLRLFWQSG